MNQNISLHNRENQPGQSDIMKIRKLIFMMIDKWYWVVVSLAIAGSTAYFYTKYSLPSYSVTSTVLIEEGDNTGVSRIDNNILDGFGLQPASRNLDNQVLILSSWTLVRNTLDKLPFDSDCYEKRLGKKGSYYPLNPIKLVPGPDGPPYNTEFSIKYSEKNIFRLSSSANADIELDTLISFGKQITLSSGYFTIFPYPEFEDIYISGEKFFFTFYNREFLIESYRERLNVVTASKDATILQLSLEGPDKSKDIIFLDKLVEVYMASNLEKKNREARRIIEFIDEQLVDVSDSLTITENQLQEFRSRNRIMDISAQAQQIIDQAVVLENEKARLTLESNYYDYLDEYLATDNNQEVPISPSTMGIEDPLLGILMQELSGLQAEYFSSGVGERNPLQAQLELRIRNNKQSLRETLQGIKLANQMAKDENIQHINEMNSQASRLPVKERQLLGFERKFNLNNVLYTFLLQQRAEAQIQKASNQPDNELIDPARADINPVAPNKPIVFLFALLLGAGLPFLILLIRNTIHNTVSSEEDIKMITELPIAGHIPHSRLSYNTVVFTEPQSRIAESFRNLRTKMEFFTKEAKSPVILITSAMPGDGKTFSAINLASAYSLAGKKTLVVEFDLRRPTLSKSFSLNGDIGLSTYLIGKNNISSIIFETDFPNLHLIPCGPIPPNPGELTSSEKARKMFIDLRKMYEFIIVDSAPIGIVSDGYSIATISDATLITVRHSKTNKDFLGATISEAQSNGINGLSLLINDLKSKSSPYRYAFNYKYEYKQKKG